MAFNFMTAFHRALQDPEAYYSFQKEMNSKAVEQVFFNFYGGKTVFEAVVLPIRLGTTYEPANQVIRVRPLGIHDFIIPEPCVFEGDLVKIQKVLDLHPIALPDSLEPYKTSETSDAGFASGQIVFCRLAEGKSHSLIYERGKRREGGLTRGFSCVNSADGKTKQPLKDAFNDGQVHELGQIVSDIPMAGVQNLTLAQLAAKVGLTERILKAIREVESKGNNKAIRFEPHIFLRIRKDLVGKIPYVPYSDEIPTDYNANNTGTAAFTRAFKLDPVAALKSTSFGLYQVVLKFADLSVSSNKIINNATKDAKGAQDFINFFYQQPLYVSDELLIAWFAGNSTAAKHAKAKKWKEFALLYNGKQCCGPKSRNKYDEKLKAAYDKYGK